MTKPRIALVALHYAEYAANLALALSEKCEVLLILYAVNAAAELGENWTASLIKPSLSTIGLPQPRSPYAVVRNSVHMVATIRTFRPTLIHYQEGIRDELALSLPFLRHVPKVLTIHDPVPHSGIDAARLRFSRLKLYRTLLRYSADMAITHGATLAAAVEHAMPKLEGKVCSIAHGPLGLGHAPVDVVRPAGNRLLFFGRIHRYKGLSFFVEAVKRLRLEGIPVTGIVAGRGSDLDQYKAEMLAAGGFEILDHFIAAADIPALFLESSVVVLPYTDGTQSGVAALALGYGRPVVASSVGSIPELVRDGINGLLVPAGDSDALVAAIRAVATDRRRWQELANGAIRLRDGELSWCSIADQTIKCYLAAIGRPHQAASP